MDDRGTLHAGLLTLSTGPASYIDVQRVVASMSEMSSREA